MRTPVSLSQLSPSDAAYTRSAALLGNFDIILSLLSTLDDGSGVKKVVDAIVDDCDAMVNLRESIVQHRVWYASLALLDERTASDFRQSALAALERYFFLVAFASFLSSSPPRTNDSSAPSTFSAWLKRRPEIKHMITRLRKAGAPGHFFVFAPVQDLSAIAKADRGGEGAVVLAAGAGGAGRLGERQGERVGDEWAEQIIRVRYPPFTCLSLARLTGRRTARSLARASSSARRRSSRTTSGSRSRPGSRSASEAPSTSAACPTRGCMASVSRRKRASGRS